ncbi:MAG: hypothetical protein FWC43_08535 [Planctomycetaceae bacterium]|nr:hypothetical protein [Planctomycetaceae bacterium]
MFYQIKEQATLRELFLTAIPSENFVCQNEYQGHGGYVPDYEAQTRSLLEQIRSVSGKEGFEGHGVMLTVFLDDSGQKQLVRKILADFYGPNQPATTYVRQKPCEDRAIAIELYAVTPRQANDPAFSITRRADKITQLQHDGFQWLYLGDILPDGTPIGAYDRSRSVFDMLKAQLEGAGFRTEQLVRTWLYQGHLLLPEGKTQRYKELNRARTDFFADRNFLPETLPKNYQGPTVYPASTGIGTDDVDLVGGAIAFATRRSDVITVPLENPNQTSAFDYSAAYSLQSPKFARAMGMLLGNSLKILVSGTAGITNSESRFGSDPVGQTELTLDNIVALISGENLRKHGIDGFSPRLDDLATARVYVKRPDDYDVVRRICEKRFPNTPVLYTIADICRPELLVEIEGIVTMG